MAAVTYVDSNDVWIYVKAALANASPASQAAFAGLKSWLSQQFGVTQLYFYGFGDIDTGLDPDLDGAYQIYGVWGKKQATATDAYLKVRDNTADRISLPFLVASEESFAIFPKGLDIANAAGFLLESHTTSTGTTDSTAGDGPTGFVIFGATK
jgi:hypothetical protein